MVEQFKLKKQEPLESVIQNEVCEHLTRKGHFFWRQNNTPIAQKGSDGRYFFRKMSKYSKKGVPDIILLSDGGYVVFLEIKRPSGLLSKDQKIFAEECKKVGAEYHTIRRLSDLIEIGL
jgi:hypothetical protein